MVTEFLGAQNNPVTLQPWCNQIAGEVFVREEIRGIPSEYLLERRENYFGSDELPDPATSVLPEPVLLLTAAVDVQVNRLESLILGWTRGRSSYVIDHRIWPCNPAQNDGWRVLGEYLQQSWATKWADGKRLSPHMIFVDSGYLPTAVYAFCKGRHYYFPTKGISSSAMPWVEPADKRQSLYHVHVDSGKHLFYTRLAIPEKSADGYVHLHIGLGKDFCGQLVSETATRDKRSGRLVFRLKKESANEALDLMVLNMAVEYQLRAPYAKLEAERLGTEAKTEPANPGPRRRRPNPWGPGGIGGASW
jgi:phage terminase large subunit GpA-like protein